MAMRMSGHLVQEPTVAERSGFIASFEGYWDAATLFRGYISEHDAVEHDRSFITERTIACHCPACAGSHALSDPQYFIPPTSGVAANGKPIYNWDQAAAQITRGSESWAWSDGTPVTVTYAFRSSMVGPMPEGAGGFSQRL